MGQSRHKTTVETSGLCVTRSLFNTVGFEFRGCGWKHVTDSFVRKWGQDFPKGKIERNHDVDINKMNTKYRSWFSDVNLQLSSLFLAMEIYLKCRKATTWESFCLLISQEADVYTGLCEMQVQCGLKRTFAGPYLEGKVLDLACIKKKSAVVKTLMLIGAEVKLCDPRKFKWIDDLIQAPFAEVKYLKHLCHLSIVKTRWGKVSKKRQKLMI